ncbi:hypothetical protein ACQUEF_14065 [Vagococcus fluvialis]|uniref:hypothetical protein n=1 Tax=Vagococcus fluvialis TaxID=2738 RepID=UPI003D0C81D5
MNEININNLKWDTDLKRILLGDKYDETNPIKNILMGKIDQNYMDNKNDYYKYSRGHLENYQIVEDVFQKLTNHKDTGFKDIMNSFWITYKCLLQIEYPKIFKPFGNEIVSIKKPPFYGEINDSYIKHYEENLKVSDVIVNDKNQKLDWITFLIDNFDRFDKVNKVTELKDFAKLTHTIGNITIVPAGFNRGRNDYDYWDYALVKLRNFLETIDSWDNYVQKNHMEPFLSNTYRPVPLLEGHLNDSKLTLPQDSDVIKKSLKFINGSIEERGRKMINSLNQSSYESN